MKSRVLFLSLFALVAISVVVASDELNFGVDGNEIFDSDGSFISMTEKQEVRRPALRRYNAQSLHPDWLMEIDLSDVSDEVRDNMDDHLEYDEDLETLLAVEAKQRSQAGVSVGADVGDSQGSKITGFEHLGAQVKIQGKVFFCYIII